MVSTVYKTDYGDFLRESLNKNYFNDTELSQLNEIVVRYACPFCGQKNELSFDSTLLNPTIKYHTTSSSKKERVVEKLHTFFPFSEKLFRILSISKLDTYTFEHTCELFPISTEISLSDFPHPISFEYLEKELTNMIEARKIGQKLQQTSEKQSFLFSTKMYHLSSGFQVLGLLLLIAGTGALIFDIPNWRPILFGGVFVFIVYLIQQKLKYRYLPKSIPKTIPSSSIPKYERFVRWGYKNPEL